MTIATDAAALGAQALVEMFVYDPSNIGESADKILRWHPGTTVQHQPIVWGGVTYNPYPVECTGMEYSGAGKLPRPTIRAANIGGTLQAFLAAMDDGLGAKITRKRTFGKYLDAVNFADGNPDADPDAAFADDVFFVSRKVVANPIFVEFELAVAFDVTGIKIPRRQVIAGTCQWIYRSAECTYAGPAVANDPVFPGEDRCGKTLASCKLRFTTAHGYDGILKTSAFPASLLARYV